MKSDAVDTTRHPARVEDLDVIVRELAALITQAINLDVDAAQIDPDAPLYGEGLGLDSLDAVELAILIQKHFGLEIKNMEEAKPAFKSLGSLAAYIDSRLSA